MTPDDAAALRRPFDKAMVGKLPKGNTMLDYVGHANTTDRLLSVDPAWTWEPVAYDPTGLPAYDAKGGLWIKLTVCGVTRLGYGDGPDPKQRIGDAIRNAAMRFGVALDLWSKEELESNATPPPPPVKTDAAWLSGWTSELQACTDIATVRALQDEAREKYHAHALTEGDARSCRALIEERMTELQKTARVGAE